MEEVLGTPSEPLRTTLSSLLLGARVDPELEIGRCDVFVELIVKRRRERLKFSAVTKRISCVESEPLREVVT